MVRRRIHLDNRATYNALMAKRCLQAAARLSREISATQDPNRREELRRRVREHYVQSRIHRRIARELAGRQSYRLRLPRRSGRLF